ERFIRRPLKVWIVEVHVRIAMTGGRQVDQPPAIPEKRHNPVDQDKVAKVIRPELRFEAVGRVAERCGHHARICDDNVERLTFCQQCVGARTHALYVGQVEFYQFEASTVCGSVLSYLLGCSLRLVQIPCRAYNLSAMGDQGPRRFHAESSRNSCTRILLPFRFTPDKTSSVVEVAPNEVASSMFVIFYLLVLNRS